MVKTYDFDVTVTGRHDVFDERFKKTAIDEVRKLSKYHSHIIDGTITLDRQNSSFKAEVFIRVPGHTFIASHEDYDLMKALDGAISKTKKQLQKLKSKVIDHRPAPQQYEVEGSESEDTEEPAE